MISILPSNFKEQLTYSKRNVNLRRYLVLSLLVVVSLGAILQAASWYANNQIEQLQQDLGDKQNQRLAFADTETKIKSLQTSLSLIEKLFSQKAHFSALLSDVARVLPAGTYLNNITLSGDDKKPVEVEIAANSLTKAGLVRNALLESSRIQIADIENITQDEGSDKYIVKLVLAFREGQAR